MSNKYMFTRETDEKKKKSEPKSGGIIAEKEDVTKHIYTREITYHK